MAFAKYVCKKNVMAGNQTHMTRKHVKKEIECSSSPCSFSEYARSSCDFFV